ncbi:cation-translocating P-type ATPase [Streptosporangium jomthongense]|uniref:HAD-IC family P-type ATPase n=1 Tax=Streptosporangium jomthongense TaxID=1193683 RepID=A0ABV8F5E2_9ACTN
MLLSRVLTLSAETLWEAVPDAVRRALPRPRAVRAAPGGFHVDLRAIGGPGTERLARRLETLLLALDGVERAEVNGVLGTVFVGGDEGVVDLKRLLSIVAELDDEDEWEQEEDEEAREAGGAAEGTAGRGPGPALARVVEQRTRAGIRLGASALGTGLAVAGRLAHLPPLSPVVPALLHLAESTPAIRTRLTRHLGHQATSALFTTANVVTGTLALQPVGLLVQAVSAAERYVEAREARRAWDSRARELASDEGAYRHVRRRRRTRTTPLEHSPVERFERLASPAALGVSVLTHVVSGSRDRGLAMMIAATPSAAKAGREAFSSAVGRTLAKRGAVVLDSHALRRMDGLDTVVLDAALFLTGSWTVERVVPLAEGIDPAELNALLPGLLDATDPGARRERGHWAAEPARLPAAEGREWRSLGLRPVRVTRRGVPVALAGLAPELVSIADALVTAPQGCSVLLAGEGAREVVRRLAVGGGGGDGTPPKTLPGGHRLTTRIRALQAEGHGVAVVSRRSTSAMAQADLSVGVLGGPDGVPWEADVLGDLETAHLLLSCLAPARRAGERCVRLSLATAAAGAALAGTGPRTASVSRARLVSDGTALAAIVVGEWTARELGNAAPAERADPTPWHALPVDTVLSRLGSSLDGLPKSEAVRRRPPPPPGEPDGTDSLLRASLEELANPLTPVLAAGAGLSAMVGSVLDGVLIGGVMIVDALIGGGQRTSANRAVHRLTESVADHVRLRRPFSKDVKDLKEPKKGKKAKKPERGSAHTTEVATADTLVPGDVIELRAGDAVPADCRILSSIGLEIDEAGLTGESLLVPKAPAPVDASAVADRSSMVYQGTTVAAGHGLAVVVASGEETEAARTARLSADERPQSGVHLRLRTLSRRILPVAIGSGVVVLVADLLRGRSMPQALALAVSLAVASVPEGLPFIASAAELAAARRLSSRETLVPNPSTIEALGRVNVLCFDKTGTLTEGRISLRVVSDGRSEHSTERLDEELRRIVAAGLRASPRYEDGKPIAHPTDRAVVEGARRLDVTPQEGLGVWSRVEELPFEPGRGYHAVLGLGPSGHVLSVKGAPEIVLTGCAHLLRDGRTVRMTAAARKGLEEEVDRLALQGYRVLAVAERPASDRRDLDDSRVDELTFLGFLCLADPVRPTAAESVGRLTRAGVRIVMITGDHPSTAAEIAAELYLLDGGRVMTGPELDEMDDATLVERLPGVAVFARTTPAHKVRIVSCLRRAGKVVAVTGDGANDAPAIRAADVGIALGSRATPAARTAADVVVTDDRIETIVDAFIEGRAMWSSVRDALSILLGGNVGEIVFAVGSNLLTGGSVLNARQLLLVNLLTDMLPAMAVAVRPPAATSPERLLAEGPEASLGASLTRDIYLRATTTAGAASMAWLIGRVTGTRGRANTIALVALISTQLFQTLASGGRDRVVLLAVIASMGVLAASVSVPVICLFFGCRPLGPVGWGIALGSSLAATLAGTAFERWTRDPSPSVH